MNTRGGTRLQLWYPSDGFKEIIGPDGHAYGYLALVDVDLVSGHEPTLVDYDSAGTADGVIAAAGVIGPDVIVANLQSFASYGTVLTCRDSGNICEDVADKRPIARHQMVYRCLGELMGNEIHALSIRAHTALEWQELQANAGG